MKPKITKGELANYTARVIAVLLGLGMIIAAVLEGRVLFAILSTTATVIIALLLLADFLTLTKE